MAIFQKWLDCMGIDGARLTVDVASDSCCRGGTISGTVRLYGGGARRCIRRIEVDFGQCVEGFTTYASVVVAAGITVEPRATHTFAYTLQVPSNVSTIEYSVRVTSTLLLGVHLGNYVSIRVLPYPEIMVMHEALQSLGFLPNDISGNPTYSAPAALQEQITRATLHVNIVDDHLQGHLILKQRQKPNLTGLKVFTEGHLQRLGIDTPRAALRGENGRAYAISMFQRLLNEALIFPHNPQNWLLRGAHNPPESQKALLRPAHGGAAEEQETLLHPVQESDP